jgi:hemolysin D
MPIRIDLLTLVGNGDCCSINPDYKCHVIAETRGTALNVRQEAQVQATSLHQELIKAQQRSKFTHLTSPVDGVVQQLAVHTIGGVVTEAQQLMIIVPSDNPLIVDVMVQNKDIGFVYPGQVAVIKVETFPFTKYGTIDATVTTVSNDAIQDEKLGLIYAARLKLSRSTIAVEDKIINLSAGMAVSAEMKTGRRRVIEYFLSPLMQYKDESLHER